MKICEAGRSTSCCRNPNIRSINTMGADTAGNFEIRAGIGVGITTETNGIRIAYTGGITVYDNTDGNIVIDNDLFTINLADDITITGDMIIAGDLTVNGTYYTVHAEHVYTEDDYIIMREGAVTGLGSGDYSGFQVKLYDGVNDGRLVIDKSGTARVGDVGDEQPLLTRDEDADLTDGDSLIWDAANSKAITAAIPSAISIALTDKMDNTHTSGTGTVTGGCSLENPSNPIIYDKVGRLCTVIFAIRVSSTYTSNYTQYPMATGLPGCITATYPYGSVAVSVDSQDNNGGCRAFVDTNGTLCILVRNSAMANKVVIGSVTYITIS